MKTANKTVTATRLVKDALKKADHFADYNIFTFLNREGALKKAAEIDEKIKNGEPVGPLAGVPFAVKDNFLSPEGPTTASSKILEPFASPITSTAVEKLEQAGAILIGRTNMDSFAHGSSTENSYFGPTKNSVDQTRVAGGSSGGSAVAVALDIVAFATGSDTGGSIRQPASFNGVYGLKPTYGAISRYGVVAMASSTDCVGFFTKSPDDLDLLMSIAAGQDPKDMTTLPDFYGKSQKRVSESALSRRHSQICGAETYIPDGAEKTARRADFPGRPAYDVSEQQVVAEKSSSDRTRAASLPTESAFSSTIGLINDFDNAAVHPEIKKALEKKVALLKKKGHKIIDLEMPTLKHALAVYYIIVPAEIASNLSRHDGIRYGFQTDKAKNLDDIYANSRAEGFMPENKRRIMIGNFVLSSGFYDAYYLKAQKARTLIIQEYENAFKQCDFILTPVAPNPAFKLGEKTGDPVAMYLEDVMSVPLNLAGVPGLAIPAGTTKDGLPIGLQLIGPRRSDQALINFAKELAE